MPPRADTSTCTGVPAGVWASALRTRLCATCPRRSRSPRTTTGTGASSSTGRDGSTARASSTASAAARRRSTGTRSSGRPWSNRASRSMSSTSVPIRMASRSTREQRAVAALLVVERPLAQQLGVAADRRERGAQLVGGVGHELAQPGLRGGLLGEGGLDVGQHEVEGPAEAAHLALLVVDRDALAEVAVRDLARGPRHVLEGPQAASYRPEGEDADGGQHGGRRAELDADEEGQRGRGRVERHRRHEHPLGHVDRSRPILGAGVAPGAQRVAVGLRAEDAAAAPEGPPARLARRLERAREDGPRVGMDVGPRGAREHDGAVGRHEQEVDVGADPVVKRSLARRLPRSGLGRQVVERLVLSTVELRVEAAQQERADRRVGDDVGDREPEDEEDRHREGEPAAQPHGVRQPPRAAGSGPGAALTSAAGAGRIPPCARCGSTGGRTRRSSCAGS